MIQSKSMYIRNMKDEFMITSDSKTENISIYIESLNKKLVFDNIHEFRNFVYHLDKFDKAMTKG